MPLLHINAGKLEKIASKSVELERHIQRLMETNLNEALDIDFVASEFSIQGGRMDTLGIDALGSPVIIEYKKGGNSSVISQIAYYYAWLADHKEAFEKLVEKAGIERKVQWDAPRLICVAESFNFYDYSAIKVLRVRVELLKYRYYEEDLLYLSTDRPIDIEERLTGKFVPEKGSSAPQEQSVVTLEEFLSSIDDLERRQLFEDAREMILELSGDIEEKINRTGVSYRLNSLTLCSVYPVRSKEISIYVSNRFITSETQELLSAKQGKNETSFRLVSEQDLESLQELISTIWEQSQ